MDAKHPGRVIGLAAIASTALCWSLAGLFVKLIDWNPFAIACGRSAIAAVFIAIYLGKIRIRFSTTQVGAALASAVTMLLFIFANKSTTSANAILLQYGAPVYVAIIGAYVLKEKPRVEHWLAFVAIFTGMGIFFMDGLGGGQLAGDIASVVSGLTFAIYFVLMRKQKDGSPLESALLAHVITAVIAFGIALFMPLPTFSPKALGAIAALGLVQIGLASVLFAFGIKRVTAIEGILVAVLEPVFNPVWVFLAVGEKPSPNALAGGAIIVIAVVVSTIVSMKRGSLVAEAEASAAERSPGV
jgi:drug/metabolite transporter (DMT)-like permease